LGSMPCTAWRSMASSKTSLGEVGAPGDVADGTSPGMSRMPIA
jgi:hypothetical protein